MPAPYEEYNDYTTHGMPDRELKKRLQQHHKMAEYAKGRAIAAQNQWDKIKGGLASGLDMVNYGKYERDMNTKWQQYNMWEGGRIKLSNETSRRRTLKNLNNPNYRSTPKWKRGK